MDAVILENRGTYILKLIINYGVVFHLDNYRSRSKPKNSIEFLLLQIERFMLNKNFTFFICSTLMAI